MSSTQSYVGKHRRPSRSAATRTATRLATTTVAGTLLATTGLLPAHAASADDFARLRQCESGGNYHINTGNGFYGAYQFDLGTWHGLGYSGRPDQASPATQDAAARELQSQRGWAPWPACSRKLGLRSSNSASRGAARVSLSTAPAHRSYRPVKAPAFHGTLLSTRLVGHARSDVRQWQAQMHRRGFAITVDGRFGPQSAAVAQRFQHDVHGNGHGAVGPVTWRLSWESKVS